MKKLTKIIIAAFSIILAIPVLAVSYWGFRHVVPPKKIAYYITESFVNYDDIKESVGSRQYVFVAYLEETYDYSLTRFTREFPEIIDYYGEHGHGFTECVVRVVKNIKGDLQEGETFSFYKGGGMVPSLTAVQLEEGDFIPQAGGYYILMGFGRPDGTVTGGGNKGTIQLEDWVTDETLEKSELYQKYVDAYKNQILPQFRGNYPSYLAAIDKNYGDGSHNAELKRQDDKWQAEYDTKWYAKMEAEYIDKVKNAKDGAERKDAEETLEWVQASRVAAENDVLRFAEEEARTATPEEAEQIRKKAQEVLEEASQASVEVLRHLEEYGELP
ncbi:MAG: hypothetical protein FWG82_00080 [Oscillospiraceae bacterium]|nr:hypothetical protein [Oscillospiraceae bacterium]